MTGIPSVPEVLAKFGGRLQHAPLVAAIRRELDVSADEAELLLGVNVEASTIVKADGWYTQTTNSANGNEGLRS